MKAFLAVAFLAGTASAQSVTCAQNEATDALFCFPPGKLVERAGIRTAPLFMGGPNAIRATPYTIAANCSTGVMHLKDSNGVSFGGASPGEGTRHSRELRRLVCAATPKAVKK